MTIAPARCFALVPCAGAGERAGTALPKQYVPVAARPLVAHTLDALAAVERLHAVLVVLAPGDRVFDDLVAGFAGERGRIARCGGATRAQTVAHGLAELARLGAADEDWVLVHDAARCLVRPRWIDRLIDACIDDDVGGLLAVPIADTIKHERDGRVAATLDRGGKWAAQTPQMFRLGLLRRALAHAGANVTDEASAVEAMGLAPKLVAGDASNFKVTWPADFELAARLLEQRTMSELRIGEGWDVHALVAGRPLVLGGVAIPHDLGLAGHSDADALLHAITDALLGAAGLGDIGRHFPDTDEAFRGADSIGLLVEAARRAAEAGWRIVNIDSTIVAQAPRLAPHIGAMRERIAQALKLDAARVNVKAKTAERMGPVGEGKAIETRAVCLLDRA